MFITYLVHELFEFMAAHDLALVHELSKLMAIREQPKFMKKVRVHEHLLFKYIHEQFMNIYSFLFTNIHELFLNVHDHPQ